MIVDAYAHCGLTRHLPVERLDEAMNDADIDACLLVQHMGEFDNSYLASIVKGRPKQFAAVCLVDSSQPDAADRLDALLSGQSPQAIGSRFLGARMTAGMIAAGGSACLDVLNRHAATLVVHLPEGIGAHIALLMGLVREYPSLLMYVPHMGWPRSGDQDTPGWRAALQELSPHLRIVFGLSAMYYFSSLPFPHQDTWPWFQTLIDVMGCERLVWASDFPLLLETETVSDNLRLFTEGPLDLTTSQRDAILGNNARRFWNIGRTL
jgi:predicted TIM-barrel fold metal-dependent hydrolase